MKQTPEVMTSAQAGEFLQISDTTLAAMVKSGRIPYLRLSGHGLRGVIRFRRVALEKWMEREERKAVVKPTCSICLLAHEFGERCRILGEVKR